MTGENVKAWRDRHGVTQMALAARLGVNHSTVWRWEHDKLPLPPWLPLALEAIAAERGQPERVASV